MLHIEIALAHQEVHQLGAHPGKRVRSASGRIFGLHGLGRSGVKVGFLAHAGGHHIACGAALQGLEDGAVQVKFRDRLDLDFACVLQRGATGDGSLALDGGIWSFCGGLLHGEPLQR